MTTSSANREISADSALDFRERVRLRAGSGELLTFRIGREWFAVELAAVAEVVESPEVRPVPESSDALVGVFSLRDDLIPLFSGSRVLGAQSGARLGAALVLEESVGRIALAIEDVDDVIRVPLSELRDAPPGAADDDVLAGLLWNDHRLVSVLHARALVNLCTASTEDRS